MPAPKQALSWNQTFPDAIKAAIVVHDSDTRIITCNEMAEELPGLSKDQMLGKDVLVFRRLEFCRRWRTRGDNDEIHV